MIFSFSKLQPITAQNSAEAEVVAMVETGKHVIFNVNLCKEMRLPLQLPVKMLTDSASGIEIVHTTKNNARSKHIDLRFFTIREWIEEGIVELEWISKEKQLADVFTKPLGKNLFTRFRSMLPVMNEETLKGCVGVDNELNIFSGGKSGNESRLNKWNKKEGLDTLDTLDHLKENGTRWEMEQNGKHKSKLGRKRNGRKKKDDIMCGEGQLVSSCGAGQLVSS